MIAFIIFHFLPLGVDSGGFLCHLSSSVTPILLLPSCFLPFANPALTTASCWNFISLKDMDEVGVSTAVQLLPLWLLRILSLRLVYPLSASVMSDISNNASLNFSVVHLSFASVEIPPKARSEISIMEPRITSDAMLQYQLSLAKR